jgi:hypothetical protein
MPDYSAPLVLVQDLHKHQPPAADSSSVKTSVNGMSLGVVLERRVSENAISLFRGPVGQRFRSYDYLGALLCHQSRNRSGSGDDNWSTR